MMGFIEATLFLLFAALISLQCEEIVRKRNETLLLDSIFKDYDKRSRPVKDYHTAIVVNLSISINQIIQVDEKNQVVTSNILRRFYWKDDFLQWNPDNYGNIRLISIASSETWTPDIQLYNSAAFDKDGELKTTKNVVTYEGFVVDALYMVVKSTCKIDVTWFPFDEQKCSLLFGSWSLSSKHLKLQLNELTVDTSGFIDNGEWQLMGVSVSSNSVFYACCPDDAFIRLNYTIHLKRRAFYYFFNLLVPCGLIGFLAMLGFTLPPESGEKLSLGATILFSLIVFLNMLSESMPANSDSVPLLGTYFNCVMFTIALSVVSTIVVNLNLNAGNANRIQGRSKKLFLTWLPRILCMNCFLNIEQDNKSGNVVTNILHCNRSGSVNTSLVSPSLHSEQIVKQEWKFVAAVVDRMCLVLSVIVTFISVSVFLAYAF